MHRGQAVEKKKHFASDFVLREEPSVGKVPLKKFAEHLPAKVFVRRSCQLTLRSRCGSGWPHGLQTLPIEPNASADPVKDGIPRKVPKASALPRLSSREPSSGRPVVPLLESDLHIVKTILVMESTPVHRSTSSLRGAGGQGGPSADAESGGHPNARAHASVTTGCSGRVESGLCSSFSSSRGQNERVTPRARCPRPVPARKSISKERRRSQPRCAVAARRW